MESDSRDGLINGLHIIFSDTPARIACLVEPILEVDLPLCCSLEEHDGTHSRQRIHRAVGRRSGRRPSGVLGVPVF
jgi:hypothetical protein